jgi:hypothetical protein
MLVICGRVHQDDLQIQRISRIDINNLYLLLDDFLLSFLPGWSAEKFGL